MLNVDEVLKVYKLSLNLSHAAINQIKQSEDENIKILTSYIQSIDLIIIFIIIMSMRYTH